MPSFNIVSIADDCCYWWLLTEERCIWIAYCGIIIENKFPQFQQLQCFLQEFFNYSSLGTLNVLQFNREKHISQAAIYIKRKINLAVIPGDGTLLWQAQNVNSLFDLRHTYFFSLFFDWRFYRSFLLFCLCLMRREFFTKYFNPQQLYDGFRQFIARKI